jgi:hypothetical protein
MKPVERVHAACEHRPYDRVPTYHASFSSWAASIVLGREAYVGSGIQQWREATALWNGEDAHREFVERTRRDTIDLGNVLDLDMVRVSYWRETEKPTWRIDENTFLYGVQDGDWRVMRFDPGTELYQEVDHSPRPETTHQDLKEELDRTECALEGYRPTPESFPEVLWGLEAYDGARAIPARGFTIGVPYSSVAWIEAVAARPDLVGRLLDLQVARARRIVEAVSSLGIRPAFGGLDLATNAGPIYAPRAFRELVVPRLRLIVDACRRLGMFFFFASDGNLWPIANDLFPEVDGYFEIDRRAGMDLRLLRERYPHLTLVGNISSHTLHAGTRGEVVEETLSCLQVARECGSVIVGCSNQIVCGTPEENLMAMLETIRENRDL